MGILNIFKKKIPEIVEIKSGKICVADKIIEYVVDLVRDKQNIKEQLKEINKVRKLSIEEREDAYLPIYLSLERVILGKKPTLTKDYFSKKILRKEKEFTQESLRKTIREKIGVNDLSDNFRVLFLVEPQRNLILYELICQKFVDLMSAKANKSISDMISKETNKNSMKGIKIEKGKFDFSSLNKKIDKNPATAKEIITAFKKLFFAFYDEVAKIDNKESADRVLIGVYNFVEMYGYPLNSDALQVLPILESKEATIAIAHRIIDYLNDLVVKKDLIKPQMEKIRDAAMLPTEEAENVYLNVYVELEKLLCEYLPPATKKAYTGDELRKEIREKIDIRHLDHRFKLLFLEEREQIIELLLVLYELFLKQIVSFWKIDELQKFVNENMKGTIHEMIDSLTIEENKINFNISQTKLSNISKSKLDQVIHELSAFLLILHKKTREITDEKKVSKAVSESYRVVRERYGLLPVFNDFVRALPYGVLDFEKKILLSPQAAYNVVTYMTEILKKGKIEEHLKSIEEARKLPFEEQSEAFFNIYLSLQHYIIEQRPKFNKKEITLSDLKEKIRRHVNVKDLEDKFQLLFLTQEEVLIKLVRDLVKECAANFIDKNALVEAEKELIKKNRLLKNIEIDEDGLIDFETFITKLKKAKTDRVKVLHSTLSKVTLVIYERSKSILGDLQAKKLFEVSYSNLQKKYGANLLQILKVIPEGLLESEKFELLGKEEVEKTAKELVKIDTMKGEFMNIAAHELKTPLVPIISYLEMLIDDKRMAKDQIEKLKICLSSAKREADLVTDILDITKLEAGSMKFEVETLEISLILKEAVMGLEPAVKQKNLYLKTDIPPKLPLVKADRRRLTQVVTNLINNATKFTEKGGITVKAEGKPQEIMISVKDTGMGISKANLKKIFTTFFQVDSSARRAQGGTGLGLAICQGIVKGHKGKLWVESEGVGKGTTFSFTIPNFSGANSKESAKEKSPTMPQSPQPVKMEKIKKNPDKLKRKKKSKAKKSSK